MATYTEIAGLLSVDDTSGLREKVRVATLVKAQAIQAETGTTQAVMERKRLAKRLLATRPNEAAIGRSDAGFVGTDFEAVYRYIVIKNKGLTLARFGSATDADIQTAVDEAVEFLAPAYNDPVA